jgi:dolichol-phosphate mannosyltransferase
MPGVNTAVVIPCYKVKKHIGEVIQSIPGFIDNIIVIDDGCPEGSADEALLSERENLHIIRHEQNQGVGGAVVSGYIKAMELGADIIIKLDGDGQMDPALMERLIEPITDGRADYTKGNRFRDFLRLQSMPKIRLIGNSVLSFMTKLSSGYWDTVDPTNGYTAIHKNALEKLSLKKLSKRFFFETDMLINLNITGAVIKDIPAPARYGDEKSSLSITKALVQFPPKPPSFRAVENRVHRPVGPRGVKRQLRLVARVEHLETAECDTAVGQDGGLVVAADVHRDGVHARTVSAHDVQRRARITVVFVARANLAAREHNPPVGQFGRRGVVVGPPGELGQFAAVGLHLPDLPPGVVVAATAGEQHAATVPGDFRVGHVPFGELGQRAQPAVGARRGEHHQVPPRAILRPGAGDHVAHPPVVAVCDRAHGLRAQHVRQDVRTLNEDNGVDVFPHRRLVFTLSRPLVDEFRRRFGHRVCRPDVFAA